MLEPMRPDLLSILRDATRLRVLAQTALLDSAAEERFDRYTRLAARLLDAPTSLLSLVDGGRQFFKSAFGLAEPWATARETPLSHSFCKHAVASGEPLVIDDARGYEQYRENLAIRDLHVLAYLGVPLLVSGQHIGALCVADGKPRSWSDEDRQTLRTLADALAAEIELSATKTLLAALTDSALDAIVTSDASGQILFCNRATELMFLRSREELLGRDVTLLMPERYRAAHRAGVERLAAGGAPRVIGHVVELHGVRADGSEFPLELSLSRMANASGALVTAVVRDVTERSLTTQALRAAEEELRLTVEHAPIGIALVAPNGRWLRVNDALAAIVGYSREELLTIDFQKITHPEDLKADLTLVQQLLDGSIGSYELEKRYVHRDGRSVSALLSVSLVRSSEGQPRFFIAQIQDISARREAERVADQKDAIVRAVIESMGDVVMVADESGEIILLNEAAKRLFGTSLAAGIATSWEPDCGLFLPDKVTRCEPHEYPLVRALKGESIEQYELWMRMPDWSEGRWHSVNGNPVRDRSGKLLGAVNVGRDVTAKKSMEEKIRSAALSDELTGLYNRRGFMLMAEQQLRLAERHGQPLHLLFIDLDGMKHINDEFGHDTGDDALIDVAMLLTRACRSADTVARLGGDEFVVLVQGDAASASAVRGRLLAAVLDHNEHSGCEYELSLSIGIGPYDPDRPIALAQLLAEADQAMYELKRRRKKPAGGSAAN